MFDSGGGATRRATSVVGVGGVGGAVVDELRSDAWDTAVADGDTLAVDVAADGGGRRLDPLADVPERHTGDGLLAPETVAAVQRATGGRAWWLQSDGDGPCAPLDDAADGLEGRRALGKATAAVSLSLGTRLGAALDELAGDAYVVVGLGGGTGSGMLFDIAERLQARDAPDGERWSVHLVGVLPANDAPGVARANAHAALSELEYRSLTGQRAFASLLLLDSTHSSAAARVVHSHATLPAEGRARLAPDAPDGPPTYAPFTVATPHTVALDAVTAADRRTTLETYLVDARSRLATELACCDALSRVVTAVGGGPAASTLDRVQAGKLPRAGTTDRWELARLRDRIDRLRDFLAADAVDAVTDGRAAAWRAAIDERVTTATDDGRMVLRATALADPSAAGRPQSTPRPDRVSWLLDEYVRDELGVVRRRLALSAATSELDSTVAAHLRRAAAPSTPAADVLGEARHDLEAAWHGYGRLRRQAEERVEAGLTAWREATRPDVERLRRLQSLDATLASLVERAERAVVETAAAVETAETTAAVDEALDGWNEPLVRLDERLDDTGLDPVGAQYDAAMERVADAKAARLTAASVPSLLRLLRRSTLAAARERYEAARTALDGGVVELSPFEAPFECDVDTAPLSAVADDVAEARRRCRERIETAYAERLTAAPLDDDTVAEALETPWTLPTPAADERAAERARRSVATALSSLGDADSVDEAYARLGTDGDGPAAAGLRAVTVAPFENVEDALNDLDAAYSALEAELGVLKRHERLSRRPQSEPFGQSPSVTDAPARGDDEAVGGGAPATDAVVVRQMRVHAEDGTAGDSARIDDPEGTALWALAPWTRTLASGALAAAPTRRPRDGYDAGDAHASRRALTVVGDTLGDNPAGTAAGDAVGDALEMAGVTAQGRHETATVQLDGPGDVAAVALVGGVTLDGVAPVAGADGYLAAYEAAVADAADDGRVRHAHGLDGRDGTLVEGAGTGAFCHRERLRDPTTDPATLGADERAVADALRARHRVRRFRSTVTPG